jgi:glycosyltransferase involved in cell wall biosynthesis
VTIIEHSDESLANINCAFGLGSEDNPAVTILMCTYNGERFLADQLNSLESQTYNKWTLVVSDDFSEDATLDILLKYEANWPKGKIKIRSGPRKGFCLNFLSLACDADLESCYFAFCDQDDVWSPEKLEVALRAHSTNRDPKIPFLYCGRTTYVTDVLKPCGNSPLFLFPPNFRNALVQSIGGGNTMVFNYAAKLLVEKAGPLDVPSHDWWLYQLISGAEGIVFYDSVPHILYRQHDGALVGGSNSISAKFRRFVLMLKGRFRDWNSLNTAALTEVRHLLSNNNQEILKLFVKIRHASIADRLRLMNICGLYRQTRSGTVSLYIAALLNKF